MENSATEVLARVLLFVWIFLLIPWIFFALAAGMAFDAGYTWRAYVFAWSLWTYPVMLVIAIAASFKGKSPLFMLLPLLNVAAAVASGL